MQQKYTFFYLFTYLWNINFKQTNAMNYAETIDYLFTQIPVFQKEGSSAYKPGLQNIELLDAWCHHPHRQYPCIHVGGTNGKGSVSHLIASILQECGYKTGLYTSPHLKDFRERMRVNGQPIPEERVISFTGHYRKDLAKDIEPSFFELTTEMAFTWFAEEQVDIAVIEVGLGGRLDSTNIITPIASVITNISLDHMNLLGNTLEKIATEKAGIIKTGVPVIIGKAENEVRKVFSDRSKDVSAAIHWAFEEYQIKSNNILYCNILNTSEGSNKEYKDLPCALQGLYQQENAATILSLIDVLQSNRWKIEKSAVYRGFQNVLKNTGLRGRWETLSENPKVICDTGHNEAGIRCVTEQLRRQPFGQLYIVMGMVNDKDVKSVLQLLPKDAFYHFTKASIHRALDEHELARLAADYGLHGETYPTVPEALNAAKKKCRPNDLIFVGGSTFIVAEVI
jgi:dihydrofolate synthase / folylpolyglutamate synthase